MSLRGGHSSRRSNLLLVGDAKSPIDSFDLNDVLAAEDGRLSKTISLRYSLQTIFAAVDALYEPR